MTPPVLHRPAQDLGTSDRRAGYATSAPTTIAVGQIDGLASLPGAISVGAFILAAAVVLGSMVLIGRRRPVPTTATTTVRAA